MKPSQARTILAQCHAYGNFFVLPSRTVDALLEQADLVKYRKPKNANGSRARCFHTFLYRRAESLIGQAREACEGVSATVTMRRGRHSATASSW